MHGGAESAIPIDRWLRETRRDDSRRFESFREQIVIKRVLDLGCGAGGFLLRAREVAESVTGVDLEKRLTPHFETNALSVYPRFSNRTQFLLEAIREPS
jgi:2-polyprenyl-3-methyl-5-hydroxy-6-metoxy-1,4-benzoquinol methylase